MVISARQCAGSKLGPRPNCCICRSNSRADYLPQLQAELMAVISKYVNIAPGDLKVSIEKQDNFEVLEVKIELPDALR